MTDERLLISMDSGYDDVCSIGYFELSIAIGTFQIQIDISDRVIASVWNLLSQSSLIQVMINISQGYAATSTIILISGFLRSAHLERAAH